jgi:hypothetical protein
MFLSPLGERLGEGVRRGAVCPLTQPLPQGGEEEEKKAKRQNRRVSKRTETEDG